MEARYTTFAAAIGWAVSCLLMLFPASAQGEPIDVGGHKQLFVDGRFIAASEGVTLTLNPPQQRGERILVADQPWEQDAHVGTYCSILREEGPNGPRFRLWYDLMSSGGLPGQGFRVVAYAESTDGIRFHKPILGLVEHRGSKQNNFVMPTGDLEKLTIGGGSVNRDDNPDCPPAKRYKSWSKFYSGGGFRGGNRLWYSADGLRWHLDKTVPTGLRAADTQPSWFWEPRIGRYIGYSREKPPRMGGYNESDDMLHWENMQIALKADREDLDALKSWSNVGSPLDFYAPTVFRYAEAPDIYIALVPIFYHWRKSTQRPGLILKRDQSAEGKFQAKRKLSWPDSFDVHLMTSRDGKHFQRPPKRQPFLRTGLEGSFEATWVSAFGQPIRMGDELWIYYFGSNFDHEERLDTNARRLEAVISRAVLRLDGFVSADAEYAGGHLKTPPVVFAGSRLELNLDTSAGGVAQVEIQDASGTPIPGFTLAEADQLNGNSVRMAVSWGGRTDVSSLAGKPVRMHLRMRSCKLYAFQFLP